MLLGSVEGCTALISEVLGSSCPVLGAGTGFLRWDQAAGSLTSMVGSRPGLMYLPWAV